MAYKQEGIVPVPGNGKKHSIVVDAINAKEKAVNADPEAVDDDSQEYSGPPSIYLIKEK